MLIKLSPSQPASAVTVERAKERLHIDTTDFDADLDALLKAATGAVEKHTGRTLTRSTWEYRIDCWPWPWREPIRIPAAPIRAVTGVAYLDEDAAEQDIDAANWFWERTPEGADLWFVDDYDLPSLSDRAGAVRVTFDAGYDNPGESGSGDDPELVLDPGLELAVLFLVGSWFEKREHIGAPESYQVPQTFEYLAAQLRIFR